MESGSVRAHYSRRGLHNYQPINVFDGNRECALYIQGPVHDYE